MPRTKQHSSKQIVHVTNYLQNNQIATFIGTIVTCLSSFWESEICDPSIAPHTLGGPHAKKNPSIILNKRKP